MPTAFVPHGGGPMPLLGDPSHTSLTAYLKGFAKTVPKPKAIVAITAHWEASKVLVSTASRPGMLFDYYGFPPETYQYKYGAPGSPELADRVLGLLAGAGIPAAGDSERGWDHGTFVPLMLMYPAAEVPVVQMSVLSSMDPGAHLALGAALAPLRDEGVLLVGSGMSFHNMAAFRRAGFGAVGGPRFAPSEEFDGWLRAACTGAGGAERGRLLKQWSEAPGARESHPREEHLIPLMVVAGAAGADPGSVSYSDYMMGTKVSGFVFGGQS